jgi:predicted ATPase
MEPSRLEAETSYFIDGFRSLRNFDLSLKPGINALVGPNGSGKTNFLDFLGFLDAVVHRGATNGISAAGGLSRVFSQENTSRHSAYLKARVCGVADIRDSFPTDIDKPYFRYEYEIEVRFSREHSAVFISKEILRIRKLFRRETDISASVAAGTIHLSRRSPSPDVKPNRKFGSRVFADTPLNPLNISDSSFSGSSKRNIKDRIELTGLAPDQCLLSIGSRYNFAAIEAIRTAITRGRSFNIQPDKSRSPDDISRPPGIMRDGSGLTATLHALQGLSKGTIRRTSGLRLARKSTFQDIIEWTKLVFPRLLDITTNQDPHTGKYLASLLIGEGDGQLRLPLQAASDGTLKWLSLVTLINSTGGVYSIEEPENFLHPKMLEYLIAMVRESSLASANGSYFIFSTHSETLINFCHPSELVIFDFVDNSTICSRIMNPERVLGQINDTGFGLGYYYASNSLPKDHGHGGGNHGENVREW